MVTLASTRSLKSLKTEVRSQINSFYDERILILRIGQLVLNSLVFTPRIILRMSYNFRLSISSES